MKSMRIVYIFIQLAVNQNVPMTSRDITCRRGRTDDDGYLEPDESHHNTCTRHCPMFPTERSIFVFNRKYELT